MLCAAEASEGCSEYIPLSIMLHVISVSRNRTDNRSWSANFPVNSCGPVGCLKFQDCLLLQLLRDFSFYFFLKLLLFSLLFPLFIIDWFLALVLQASLCWLQVPLALGSQAFLISLVDPGGLVSHCCFCFHFLSHLFLTRMNYSPVFQEIHW